VLEGFLILRVDMKQVAGSEFLAFRPQFTSITYCLIAVILWVMNCGRICHCVILQMCLAYRHSRALRGCW